MKKIEEIEFNESKYSKQKRQIFSQLKNECIMVCIEGDDVTFLWAAKSIKNIQPFSKESYTRANVILTATLSKVFVKNMKITEGFEHINIIIKCLKKLKEIQNSYRILK